MYTQIENYKFVSVETLYNIKIVSVTYLLPSSIILQVRFPRLRAYYRASRFSFSPSRWCIEPPNNFALSSRSRHKDIPRSPASHLLNSSAYVSLIRVCKSIAMEEGKGRGMKEDENRRDEEDCVWSGRRCSCFHELRTARRSKEYLLSPISTSCHASHGEGLTTGWSD